jgi:hypothetical protein
MLNLPPNLGDMGRTGRQQAHRAREPEPVGEPVRRRDAAGVVPKQRTPYDRAVSVRKSRRLKPPPSGSPRFARGTAWGAWVRFPLLAGGTLRRGLSGILVFVNFGCAIGISTRFRTRTAPAASPRHPLGCRRWRLQGARLASRTRTAPRVGRRRPRSRRR